MIVPKELNICVQFPDGSTNPFMVQTTDSVEDLKRKIECESGIAMNSQILQVSHQLHINTDLTLQCRQKHSVVDFKNI